MGTKETRNDRRSSDILELLKRGWKQSIPVNIHRVTGEDTVTRLVFFEALSLTKNEDDYATFYHGNKRFDIELKRGQMIFNMRRFCRETHFSLKSVSSSLRKLQKWELIKELKRQPFGFILSWNSLDDLTSWKQISKNWVLKNQF